MLQLFVYLKLASVLSQNDIECVLFLLTRIIVNFFYNKSRMKIWIVERISTNYAHFDNNIIEYIFVVCMKFIKLIILTQL